jgi:hypothetical protein
MSRVGLGVALVVAVLIGLATWVVGVVPTLIAMLVLLLLTELFVLFVSRTSPGKRLGQALGMRLGRTRVGKRMARASMRAQAEKRGIPTVDRAGRPLSDVELQLELADTPEAQAIKRQLRGMNPQQRAQALRMMAAQMESAAAGNPIPQPAPPPGVGRQGRQGGRPAGGSRSGGTRRRHPRRRRG